MPHRLLLTCLLVFTGVAFADTTPNCEQLKGAFNSTDSSCNTGTGQFSAGPSIMHTTDLTGLAQPGGDGADGAFAYNGEDTSTTSHKCAANGGDPSICNGGTC